MHRFLASIAVVTALLLACGGDDGGGNGFSAEAACDDAAGVYCDAINTCSSFYIRAAFTDLSQCKTRVKLECMSRFDATGTSLTPARLNECANAVRGQTGCGVLDQQPDACKTAAGTLADGNACAVDDQCAGRHCRLAQNSTCGACTTRQPAGQACETTGGCEEGLVCANRVCATRGKKGDACTADRPCLVSLVCNSGTCADAIPAGMACTPKRQQDPDHFDPCERLKGFFCHPTRNVCTAIELAAPGQTCGLVNATFVGCSGGGNCKTSAANPFQGTCQAPAADGATCNDTDGPKCTVPARCKGGVCTLPDPNACK